MADFASLESCAAVHKVAETARMEKGRNDLNICNGVAPENLEARVYTLTLSIVS
jgi:hypothetical protein